MKDKLRFRRKKRLKEMAGIVYLDRLDDGSIIAVCTCGQFRSSKNTLPKIAMEAKEHVNTTYCEFRSHYDSGAYRTMNDMIEDLGV